MKFKILNFLMNSKRQILEEFFKLKLFDILAPNLRNILVNSLLGEELILVFQ